MTFRPGPLTGPDADRLNRLERAVARLTGLRVQPPLTRTDGAGNLVIGLDPSALAGETGDAVCFGFVASVDSVDCNEDGTITVNSTRKYFSGYGTVSDTPPDGCS